MALHIHKLNPNQNQPFITLTQKLWYTADKSEVVPDLDPRAAFLLGGPGHMVPVAEAKRLGLVESEPETKPRPKPETKPIEPEETKVILPDSKEVEPAKGKKTK